MGASREEGEGFDMKEGLLKSRCCVFETINMVTCHFGRGQLREGIVIVIVTSAFEVSMAMDGSALQIGKHCLCRICRGSFGF